MKDVNDRILTYHQVERAVSFVYRNNVFHQGHVMGIRVANTMAKQAILAMARVTEKAFSDLKIIPVLGVGWLEPMISEAGETYFVLYAHDPDPARNYNLYVFEVEEEK